MRSSEPNEGQGRAYQAKGIAYVMPAKSRADRALQAMAGRLDFILSEVGRHRQTFNQTTDLI